GWIRIMTVTGGRYSLPRSRRIRDRRIFAALKDGGRRLACGCLLLNWRPVSDQGSKLGVVASRRIGGAVVRNRARRLLREAFRMNQARLIRPAEIVLIARASIVGCDFHQVEMDLLQALRRASLIQLDRPVPQREGPSQSP